MPDQETRDKQNAKPSKRPNRDGQDKSADTDNGGTAL